MNSKPRVTPKMTREYRRAERTASRLVSEYAIRTPADIDIEAIALDQGLYVTTGPLSGSWARLLRRGSGGVVRISSSIHSEGQRRFCVAHEIGHFLLHADQSQIERCKFTDLLPGHARRTEEPEANAFAGELLMPKKIFSSYLDGATLSLEKLDDLSSAFTATISATIHRVVDLAVHVCALVRSEAGRMRSFHVCHDFPFRLRSMGSRLDARSCAGEFFRDGFTAERQADVPADAWLEDHHLQGLYGHETIRELTVPMPKYDTALTLLWIVPGSSLDDVAAELDSF